MNSIVRTSLLASIQTIRTILLGMEAMLRSDIEKESQVVRLNNVDNEDGHVDEKDLGELARRLGIVPMNGAENV